MGWFVNLFKSVDIGVRPANVFEGTKVNLYPFTRLGMEGISQNLEKLSEPVWFFKDRCLSLSETDSSHLGLLLVIGRLEDAGLKLRFYGRLKNWDRVSPW